VAINRTLVAALHAQQLREQTARPRRYAYYVLAEMVGIPNQQAKARLRDAVRRGYLQRVGPHQYNVTPKGMEHIYD